MGLKSMLFGEDSGNNPYMKNLAETADQLKGMYGNQSAANQSVMSDIMAGRTAQIDENSFKNNYVNPMSRTFNKVTNPAIKASMGSNFWSSSRQAQQQNAAMDLNQQLSNARMNMQNQVRQGQLQGIGMQQSALQGSMAGYGQAAQTWKPKSGLLDYLNTGMALGSNAMQMYGNYQGAGAASAQANYYNRQP